MTGLRRRLTYELVLVDIGPGVHDLLFQIEDEDEGHEKDEKLIAQLEIDVPQAECDFDVQDGGEETAEPLVSI